MRFAAASYQLILSARTEPALRETQKLAGGGEIVVCDVSQPDQVDRLVATTLDRFGRLDLIVHCAGDAPMLSLAETTPQRWREVMDVNVSSALYLARSAWPTFVKQHAGVIVNISSLAARDPFPGFFAYGAAKAALNNLGITLAREGKTCGVRVHTVAPGMTDTPMFQKPARRTSDPAGTNHGPRRSRKNNLRMRGRRINEHLRRNDLH